MLLHEIPNKCLRNVIVTFSKLDEIDFFKIWQHTDLDRKHDNRAYIEQMTTTDTESSYIVFDYLLIHVRHA